MKTKVTIALGVIALSGCIMACDTKQVSAIVSNTPSINNSQTTIKGNNQISTDNRTITEFSKINVKGNVTVIITDDLSHKIEVTTDSNIQNYVKVANVDGTLNLYTEGTIKPSQGIIIKVPYNNNLSSIVASASAKISVLPTIQATNFDFNISSNAICNVNSINVNSRLSINTASSGTLNIINHSEAKTSIIKASSRSEVNGQNLIVDNAKVNASSSGKISLTVNSSLDARATTSGKVEYFGSPFKKTITKRTSGQVVSNNK